MPDAKEILGAVSINPATGELIERFPFQTGEEIERLLAGAEAAYRVWRAKTLAERAAVYVAFEQALLAQKEPLAATVTAEMGKTLREARAEVDKCAATAKWYAERGPAMLLDEPVEVEGGDRVYVSYLPVGSILGIMPWNFPLWQAVRAAVPVMLSGNGFILKPAPNTMRCASMLGDAWAAAGLPEGLFSILNADNDGAAAVLADRRVAGVTLTGSLRAGTAIAALAGKLVKRSLLELGGADPFLVLADADLEKAVAAAIPARYSNNGQVCLNAKRFILEAPVAEEFTARFVEAVKSLKVGDPRDPATTQGPVARGDLRDGIHDQVTRSIEAGAKLLLGGRKVEGPGFFYEPTVLAEVAPGMAAFDEEIFGPVAAITVARDVDHAVELANTSDLGLSGNLWTSDLGKAREIARRMETGGVFVNGFTASNARVPVGGVKRSGYGRELSHFGIREFTNPQTVWMRQL